MGAKFRHRIGLNFKFIFCVLTHRMTDNDYSSLYSQAVFDKSMHHRQLRRDKAQSQPPEMVAA